GGNGCVRFAALKVSVREVRIVHFGCRGYYVAEEGDDLCSGDAERLAIEGCAVIAGCRTCRPRRIFTVSVCCAARGGAAEIQESKTNAAGAGDIVRVAAGLSFRCTVPSADKRAVVAPV